MRAVNVAGIAERQAEKARLRAKIDVLLLIFDLAEPEIIFVDQIPASRMGVSRPAAAQSPRPAFRFAAEWRLPERDGSRSRYPARPTRRTGASGQLNNSLPMRAAISA